MAVFAISDLHLSLGTDKPMNVFGEVWDGYEEKLKNNWNQIVAKDDTVIVCGDISWAMYLENAGADFAYINELNGRKLISKGNHDYWWSTVKKQREFIMGHGFCNIDFLHNNAFLADNIAICGTRGWLAYDACKTDEDKKIYNRELERFELSAKCMDSSANFRIAALHYPPDGNFAELFKKYAINVCVFGHLHAKAQNYAKQGVFDGTLHKLVSCDYLDFTPMNIRPGII